MKFKNFSKWKAICIECWRVWPINYPAIVFPVTEPITLKTVLTETPKYMTIKKVVIDYEKHILPFTIVFDGSERFIKCLYGCPKCSPKEWEITEGQSSTIPVNEKATHEERFVISDRIKPIINLMGKEWKP